MKAPRFAIGFVSVGDGSSGSLQRGGGAPLPLPVVRVRKGEVHSIGQGGESVVPIHCCSLLPVVGQQPVLDPAPPFRRCILVISTSLIFERASPAGIGSESQISAHKKELLVQADPIPSLAATLCLLPASDTNTATIMASSSATSPPSHKPKRKFAVLGSRSVGEH